MNNFCEYFTTSNEILVGYTTITHVANDLPLPTFSQAHNREQQIVEDSYLQLARELFVPERSIITCKQTHSDVVVRIRKAPSQSVRNLTGSVLIADGVFTNIPGLILAVSIADCAGVLLYDSENGAIASVHSGWRGTHQNIVGKAIVEMKQHFGTDVCNVQAWVSPCAHSENYEVQADVAQYFPNNVNVHPHSGKMYLDNVGAITQQMINLGVPATAIIAHADCTISNEKFHSYRRDQKKSGRGLAFIGMGIAKGVSL